MLSDELRELAATLVTLANDIDQGTTQEQREINKKLNPYGLRIVK